MSRQEEFDDIPDLGPARDELDRSDIPTLKPLQPAASAASPVTVRKGSSGGVYLLLLLLLLAVGALAYWSFDQQLRLQRQLAELDITLAQSEQRLSDMEALVNASDDSASKSGEALQALMRKQIQEGQARTKYVDSEIAKLWVVYQKFQPKVQQLEAQLQQHDERLVSQKAELKTVGGSLDTLGMSLDQQGQAVSATDGRVSEVGKQLLDMEKRVNAVQQQDSKALQQLKNQLRNQDLANQEVDDLQAAQLKDMQKKLNTLARKSGAPSDLQQLVQEHQKSLDSIDANRRQVNAELLRLRQRVAQLQLAVDTTAARTR